MWPRYGTVENVLVAHSRVKYEPEVGAKNATWNSQVVRGAEYLFGTSKIAIEKHRPSFDRESKVIVIGDFAGFSWTYFFTQNQSHDFHIESERQID